MTKPKLPQKKSSGSSFESISNRAWKFITDMIESNPKLEVLSKTKRKIVFQDKE